MRNLDAYLIFADSAVGRKNWYCFISIKFDVA